MDCSELARTLDAYLDGELDRPEQDQLEAHLRACGGCRATAVREGHARTALRAQLRSAMGHGAAAGTAPAELRDRIHLALVAKPRETRTWFTPLRLAVLGACAAGALILLALYRGPDPMIDEAVRRHARDLPLEVTVPSSSPDSVAGWFNGKLDFNPSPPRFASPIRIVGGRLSHIGDRPAAYLRYEAPRGRLGVFIFDDPERRYEGTGRAVKLGAETVRVATARGFSVAVWRRGAIVYSLVSDLDEGDLIRLADGAQASVDR